MFAKLSMTEVRAKKGVCAGKLSRSLQITCLTPLPRACAAGSCLGQRPSLYLRCHSHAGECSTYHCYKGGCAQPPEGLVGPVTPLCTHQRSTLHTPAQHTARWRCVGPRTPSAPPLTSPASGPPARRSRPAARSTRTRRSSRTTATAPTAWSACGCGPGSSLTNRLNGRQLGSVVWALGLLGAPPNMHVLLLPRRARRPAPTAPWTSGCACRAPTCGAATRRATGSWRCCCCCWERVRHRGAPRPHSARHPHSAPLALRRGCA
jgi:hypothetical protein